MPNTARRSRVLTAVAALVSVTLGTASVGHAQGFGLSEIGACAIARGFAVTGATCHDASVIYWNPGAAAQLPQGLTLTVGGSLIKVNGGFRQDTTNRRYAADPPTEFPPYAFGTYTRGRWSLGFGAYLPYGLTSEWNDDFPGRFVALKAALKTFYFQPNLSFAITPEWSVGVGPVYGYSSVQLVQAIDLAPQPVPGAPAGTTFGLLGIPPGTEFGRAQLKGTGSAWGVNAGIHGVIDQHWEVGARYLSALKFKYNDADVTFRQTPTGLQLSASNPLTGTAGPLDALLTPEFTTGGPLVDQKGHSNITHPWQAQAGIGYTGFTGTTLSFDVERVGWSSFKTLPVTFEGPASGNNQVLIEDYKDTWAFRAGAEHVIQQHTPFHDWALRGGFSYAQTPAPDETVSPLLPDMNRRNLSMGVGIPLASAVRLDASFIYVSTGGRRGRIVERTSAGQTAADLNSGSYDLSAQVVSLGVTASF